MQLKDTMLHTHHTQPSQHHPASSYASIHWHGAFIRHTSVATLHPHEVTSRLDSPLTESVQAGQDFGVVVAVQTYAADQELLVNLADHRTGKSGAFTGHPKALT